MPTLLTPKQQETIKSKRLYWEEIAQRDNKTSASLTATQELRHLLNDLSSMTILLIIAQYSRTH